MPLTPEDVQKKQFSTVRFKEGYDEEEVDAFLDEVEAELRRLLAEHQSLSRVAQSAPAAAAPAAPAAPPPPVAPAEDPNETALRTLLLAQRTADEAIAQARAEAEQVVAQARTRAGSIESEAQQRHAVAIAELQRQRETFERQIDNLRAFEREYRTRLKAYLEGQMRELDTRTAEPPPLPTSPPAAPRAPSASPVPPPAGAAAPVAASVPPLAPPSRPVTPGASPFTPGRPLVEDVDSGSDTPGGPPREADDDSDIESGSTDA
jgi:DivIVA domain-containing protein